MMHGLPSAPWQRRLLPMPPVSLAALACLATPRRTSAEPECVASFRQPKGAAPAGGAGAPDPPPPSGACHDGSSPTGCRNAHEAAPAAHLVLIATAARAKRHADTIEAKRRPCDGRLPPSRGHGARPRRGGARTFAEAIFAAVLTAMLLVPGSGSAGQPDGAGNVGLLWLPAEDAPVVPRAIVVALYDTTGIDRRGWHYAEQITAAGIAVLHVDLQDTAADDGTRVAGEDERAAALMRLRMVVDTLSEDPRFAGAPIGLMAFGSAGQAATIAAADAILGSRIAALILLYPGCAVLDAAVTAAGRGPRSPVLLLHGDADPANSPAACIALEARLARTAPIRRVQYAGAGYAWDLTPSGQYEVVRLPWPGRDGERLTVRYWPEGAALSATQAASFFAATLRAPRP